MAIHTDAALRPGRRARAQARAKAEAQEQARIKAEQAHQARVVAVQRAARQITHHERGKIALVRPVAWLGGLQVTAYLLQTVAVPAVIQVLLVGVGAAGVLGWAERRGQARPITATAAAAGWMLASIPLGPSLWMALALWVPGLVMAVPYWMGVLARPARRPAAAVEAAPPRLGAEVSLYVERVVPNNVAFKSTHLADVGPVPDGYTGIIVGEPGVTLFSKMSAASAVETIASANRVRPSQVAVESVDDGDASRARLTVIRSDGNLQGTVHLEDSGAAIDPQTGIAQVGRFFDMQPAHRQFFTPTGGVQMGAVVGDTGSGKSGYGESLIALAHRSELAATVLLDPQGGASQVNWSSKTHIYAEGQEGVWEKLQMLDFVMDKREDFVAHVPWVDELGRERTGKPFLLPGDPALGGMTMMMIFLEELRLFLDGPFGKQALELLGTGVRTWRKPGGSLTVFNQNLGLDSFGNSQSFRANLLSGGSLAAFRTGSSTDHAMVGLPSDPSKLPEYFRNGSKTHGLGYLTGIDRRPAAPWRSMPCRDAFGIAVSPAAGRIDDRTLGYIEEYNHQQARGRTPVASASAPVVRTSGDVQAAVAQALQAGPMEVGAVCIAVRRQLGEVRLSEIPAALRTLTTAGRVRGRGGDLYELTPDTEEAQRG